MYLHLYGVNKEYKFPPAANPGNFFTEKRGKNKHQS